MPIHPAPAIIGQSPKHPPLNWWTGEDSNLRSSKERQIYSLLPLTTRPPVLTETELGPPTSSCLMETAGGSVLLTPPSHFRHQCLNYEESRFLTASRKLSQLLRIKQT